MRGVIFIVAALALAPVRSSPALAKLPGNWARAAARADELLGADRALGKVATSRSAAGAVAARLDDDVVMFIVPQSRLARGKADAVKLLQKALPGGTRMLEWTPIRVGISADGTNGFSYGFASRAASGNEIALNKYLAYWVRKSSGWRIAAFKLVPRPEGSVSREFRPAALPARLVRPTNNAAAIAGYTRELDRAERAFSDESQIMGLGAAFRKYGSVDAMNVGGEADFTYGNEAIAAGFGDSKSSPLRWAPTGVRVASSGDLGFTYGYLERNGPVPPGKLARIPWFTVWRRASPKLPWRYVAE